MHTGINKTGIIRKYAGEIQQNGVLHLKACSPVMALPSMSAWISWVPTNECNTE